MSEPKRNSAVYIEDMLEAIAKIEKYMTGRDFASFSADEMAMDAVIRNFEIIGEAAGKVPQEIKDRFPQVEWKEMIGFRNVLIHDYSGVDVESVWETILKNLPSLKVHLLAMRGQII